MADFQSLELDIRSRIVNEGGDDEETSSRVRARLRPDESGYLLLYREESDGGDVLTEIRREADRVTVTRRGAVKSVMVFGKEPYRGLYEIPPYSFDMTVTTESIRDTLTEAGGSLALLYRMTVGGAEKKVALRITRADG